MSGIPDFGDRRLLNLAAAVLISIFCLQATLATLRLSATSDEPTHIAAGYSYWKMRDFKMNPEHPPLAKLLASIPLLLMHPRFDTEDWKTQTEGVFGLDFLYSNDADRLLFWCRLPMILLAALGAAVTFLWARDLYGPAAGLFALILYVFCPDLLGHGMLVTTDVPLAVFTVLTLYLFWKRCKNTSSPTWQADVAIGLAFGAAMATKFSGAILGPIILAFCVGRKQIKSFFVIAAVALVVIESSYFFSVSPDFYIDHMQSLYADRPADYQYYLLGDWRAGTWWYYFLVAFAVKATVPVVLFLLLASTSAIRGVKDRWGEGVLVVSILVFLIGVTAGAVPIGVRYILPIFPLVYVWSSRITSDFLKTRWRVAVLALLLAWHAWSPLSVFPNYIPYFNEFAGGPAGGPAILDDSNIDWGQGLKQAAEYVRAKHLGNGSLFGNGNLFLHTVFTGTGPLYYGLPQNLTEAEITQHVLAGQPMPGTYIVSADFAIRAGHWYPHWKKYKPIDKIAESLWVYKF